MALKQHTFSLLFPEPITPPRKHPVVSFLQVEELRWFSNSLRSEILSVCSLPHGAGLKMFHCLGAGKPLPQASPFPHLLRNSIGLSFQAYLAAFPVLLPAFLPYFELSGA